MQLLTSFFAQRSPFGRGIVNLHLWLCFVHGARLSMLLLTPYKAAILSALSVPGIVVPGLQLPLDVVALSVLW